MRGTLLLVLAACGTDADSKPSTLADTVRGVAERMHVRFAETQRIERGVVASDLDAVHAGARAIASLDEPDVLPVWQPYLAAVKLAAHDLDLAEDIATAAPRLAELGRRCASCHLAAGGKLAFRAEPRPDPSTRLPAMMTSHQWAVARMWEGLIGPSDERWLAGARALERAPLTVVAESGELGIADDVVLIRLLARRAATLQVPDERAELYGRLLGTCARCHATIRD